MKFVQSRHNPQYKALRQRLRDRAEDWLWLEGRHLCQEYLARVGPPELVVLDAARLAGGDAELVALSQGCPGAEQLTLPADLLEGLSAVAGAQGVAMLALQPVPVVPARLDSDCVILDRLQDPGNVGSIVRSCAAAGIETLITLEGGASAWGPKVLRAGQGAHFALRIFDQVTPDWLSQRLAVPLVVTTLESGHDLYQAAWTDPVAWMFGHEGQGVAPRWLTQAQHRVFIPQTPGVESLNVAAAAAVCLFEQRRQRRAGPG